MYGLYKLSRMYERLERSIEIAHFEDAANQSLAITDYLLGLNVRYSKVDEASLSVV